MSETDRYDGEHVRDIRHREVEKGEYAVLHAKLSQEV